MFFQQNTTKIKIIALILIINAFLAPFRIKPFVASAASTLQYLIDQLSDQLETKKEEIRQLEKDAEKYKSLIEQKRKEVDSLKKEIGLLETEIAKVSNDIKKTNAQIDKTNIEINDTELEIVRFEKEISNQKVVLAYLVVDMYEKTQDSNIEIFLRNNNLSDYYNNKEYADVVENNAKGALDNLKDIKFNLEKTKTDLESKKRELDELKKTLQAQKNLLDDKKEEKDNLLASTKGKERKYQQIKSELEKKQQDVQKEIYELEDKIRLAVKPKNLPSPGSGVLNWPIADPEITQGYGSTNDTGFKNPWYKFHNGVDFRAPTGIAILAAADGTITATGNNGKYAYGKWILIKHNNGLSTLYGHLSQQLVSSGDTVKKGSAIGLSGNTGYSTGAHLHFTVYDSDNVSVKESSFGVGSLPIGYHLNPMLYL